MGSFKDKNGSSHNEVSDTAASRGLGIRHLQISVMAAASMMAYSLRYNLSVAIVAMVQYNNTNTADPPLAQTYDWNEEIQGYILGSFFWGYCITQIPGGLLAQRFGGHRFLCASILGSAVFSILMPQCAYYGGWQLVCVNRMIQGVSQGFIYPSVFNLLGVWAPPSESSKLGSIAVSAQLLGTVISTPLAGFLCSSYGWPVVFYSMGGFCFIFGVGMIFLGADTPAKHRMISNAERNYIQNSLGKTKVKLSVPWLKVFSSVPFLAAIFTLSANALVYITFLTKLPTYMATVLKFSMKDNGVLSALPHLMCWLLSYVFAWISEFLTDREWLKPTAVRKLCNSISFFGSAFCLVLLANTQDRVLSVVILIAYMGVQGGTFVGVMSTFVDLAPNFSGAIYSIANFLAACSSFVSPILVSLIVTETGNAEQWRIVFYLSAACLVLGNTVFLIFCTAETQKWNWPDGHYNRNYKSQRGMHSRLSLTAI